MTTASPKKILITYARSFLALELARQLRAAGHEIYIADSMHYPISLFSNAVKKRFKVPSPRYSPKEYIDGILNIVKKEHIDLLIPIYEEITWLSKVRQQFPSSCELFFPDFDQFEMLHNKWTYQCKLSSLGIPTLKNAIIRDRSDLDRFQFDRPFALKACYSRASQKVRKVYPHESLKDLTFDPNNPWLAQEWMDGNRYCTYSICRQGSVLAHSTYPVRYAIDGNSCVTFETIHHEGVYEWIKKFVKLINFTGQIAFDFIESPVDKQLYTIECNPRATSGVLLFKPEDGLDKAFLNNTTATIFPQQNARKQIAMGMLLYGWRKNALPNNSPLEYLKTLFTTGDVVLRLNDIKPFLFEPLTMANTYLISRKHKLSFLDAFIHDHEWNGEKITL